MTFESKSNYAAHNSLDDSINRLRVTPGLTSFDRRLLTFHIGDAPIQAFCYVCEIDSIGIKVPHLYDKGTAFFTYLKQQGLTSVLIDHFALCEQKGEKYHLPSSNSIIMILSVMQPKGKKPLEKTSATYPQYIIQGFENIKAIGIHDPLFYLNLYWACSQNLCEVSRIDLFMNFSYNIMDLLIFPITNGKVQSLGNGVISMFGRIGEHLIQGQAVGPDSKVYKTKIQTLKSSDKANTVLETVYIGKDRWIPHVILFYNKKTQKANQKQQNVLIGSRIEVRLSSRSSNFYKEVLPLCLLSLVSSIGFSYRQYVFCMVLFAFCRVTTIQQPRGENTGYISVAAWSSWWLRLLELVGQSFFYVPQSLEDRIVNAEEINNEYHVIFQNLRYLWMNEGTPEQVDYLINENFRMWCNWALGNPHIFHQTYPPFIWLNLNTKQQNHLPNVLSPYTLDSDGSFDKQDLLYSVLFEGKLGLPPNMFKDLLLTPDKFMEYQKKPPTIEIACYMLSFADSIENWIIAKEKTVEEGVNIFNTFQKHIGSYEIMLELVWYSALFIDYHKGFCTKEFVLEQYEGSININHWLVMLDKSKRADRTSE